MEMDGFCAHADMTTMGSRSKKRYFFFVIIVIVIYCDGFLRDFLIFEISRYRYFEMSLFRDVDISRYRDIDITIFRDDETTRGRDDGRTREGYYEALVSVWVLFSSRASLPVRNSMSKRMAIIRERPFSNSFCKLSS